MNTLCIYADEMLQKLLFADAVHSLQSAGTILLKEGQKCQGLYLLKRGKACVYLPSTKDKARVEQFVEEGCILGLPAAVNGRKYSLTAELVQDSEVAFIPLSMFSDLMRKNIDIAMKVLDLLSKEVQALRQTIKHLKPPTIQ